MGIVYYAHYLTWFEVGRTELLRQLGTSYRKIEKGLVFLPVTETHCHYVKPALYDDLIHVKTQVRQVSRARLKFDYKIERADDNALLATGMTIHVSVNKAGRPQRLPAELVNLLQTNINNPT